MFLHSAGLCLAGSGWMDGWICVLCQYVGLTECCERKVGKSWLFMAVWETQSRCVSALVHIDFYISHYIEIKTKAI